MLSIHEKMSISEKFSILLWETSEFTLQAQNLIKKLPFYSTERQKMD